MKSSVIKRSIVIKGHKTSVSLEDPFWQALKDLSAEKNVTVSALINSIDQGRDTSNLSSAVRQFVMRHYYEIAMRKPATARPALAEVRTGVV
jgi:predicted DNA-binding ribbon-helix-helix protein